MTNKRSPLKDKPLRNPGQSLDEQIRDMSYDYFAGPMLLAFCAVLIAALEWLQYFRPRAPSPYLFTAIGTAVLAFAVIRFYRTWTRLRSLKLGRDGEKEVGQKLEELRSQGYEVFHDVVVDGFNLDHVLIGPAGVFVVETKTVSKTAKRNARIVVADGRIVVDGQTPDRDPFVQARAQSDWLRRQLAKSTGRNFAVKGVIVYPGWWVDDTRSIKKSCWVLNPKMLSAFLDREPRQLGQEDINLASYHLSRIVKTPIT